MPQKLIIFELPEQPMTILEPLKNEKIPTILLSSESLADWRGNFILNLQRWRLKLRIIEVQHLKSDLSLRPDLFPCPCMLSSGS